MSLNPRCFGLTLCERLHGGRMRITRAVSITVILAVLAIGCGLIGLHAGEAAPPRGATSAAMVVKCTADLAQRLKLPAGEITEVTSIATTWPDAALGMPEAGKMYAQVLTPGWKIILQARNSQYLYTASATACRYGGPVALWAYSMLYVASTPNEPNLNGDLYQCSLLGTNSVRIATGVSDYYPQAKGGVIITQRTSRSSFDLLFVKADGKGKTTPLHSAFAFGEAAMNDAQNAWTAYVKPGVGGAWTVAVARMGQRDTNVQTFPLPDGVQPGRIAWLGDNVTILVKDGLGRACYELTPGADKPAWKVVPEYTFPGLRSYMLNKSESLEIDQVMVNGQPAVEVARVWFTGDRKVKATIPGLTLRGHDFLGDRYAVIWGELAGAPAAFTVDIATGEIIPGIRTGRDFKPFEYAPISTPVR